MATLEIKCVLCTDMTCPLCGRLADAPITVDVGMLKFMNKAIKRLDFTEIE